MADPIETDDQLIEQMRRDAEVDREFIADLDRLVGR